MQSRDPVAPRSMLAQFAKSLDSHKLTEYRNDKPYLKVVLERPAETHVEMVKQAARAFGVGIDVERVTKEDGERVTFRAGTGVRTDSFALPWTVEEPQRGIGTYLEVVDLAEYAGEGNVADDGRCGRCGYDRGEAERHTEAPGEFVTCRECGAELVEDRDQ